MAILGALLSLISKKIGDLARAILGWSVTALFGRLPTGKQTALSFALVASLLWPLLVVGIFVPAVTAWAFAALPIHKWLGDTWVRVITVALALVIPPVVGLITQWVAPPAKLQGGVVRTVIHGYPLTLGYAISCLVTAVTVPLVKLASLARRWEDEHVYVQPKEGEYAAALGELVRACDSAGVEVVVEPVPGAMALSTRVLKWFARGALDPIVASDPKRLRGNKLELYLYPADLLLRGEKKLLARVRARMTRTMLERHAFLVAEPQSQELAKELQRMWGVVERHDDPARIGGLARGRLAEIRHDLDEAYLPFDEWVTLDRSLQRLDIAIGTIDATQAETIAATRAHDALAERKQSDDDEERQPMATMPNGPHADDTVEMNARMDEPVGELVKDAIADAKDLIRLEVALAKNEVRKEVKELETSAILFGVAIVGALMGTAMLLVALVLAIAPVPLTALIVGGVLLVGAGVAAFVALKELPKKPMDRTRRRLKTDLNQLKEHVA